MRWVIFLLACTPSIDPVPTAPSVSFDGGLALATLPDASSDDAGALAPTGYYDFHLDVLADTCTPKLASAPESEPTILFVKTSRGKTTLNLPYRMGALVTRFDMEVGHPHHWVAPCQQSTDLEIVAMTPSVVRVRRKETYGDASGCSSALLRNCRRDLGLTWTLQRALCEPGCNPGTVKMQLDGGVEVTCDCRPDP